MIKIAVFYGHGINCDRETSSVLKQTMASKNTEGRVQRVHTNQFIKEEKELEDYQMLVIPGGFLHGDDISAGKILASKLKNKLSGKLESFIRSGKLLLGICNGFQVLAKYPVLPSPDKSDQEVTLTWNNSRRFEDRWVWLKVNKDSPCIYLKGIDRIRLPIRHAEGKFLAEDHALTELENANQIALRYCKEDGTFAEQEYPHNPNGSLADIAGICDRSGRIFGLMPHPEAFHSYFNHPDWVKLKTTSGGKEMKTTGRKIFENALDFLEREFG